MTCFCSVSVAEYSAELERDDKKEAACWSIMGALAPLSSFLPEDDLLLKNSIEVFLFFIFIYFLKKYFLIVLFVWKVMMV